MTPEANATLSSGGIILKSAVERFKIPLTLRQVQGERDFESHPIGERRTAAHASTWLGTNDFSAFQLPFLGLSTRMIASHLPGIDHCG